MERIYVEIDDGDAIDVTTLEDFILANEEDEDVLAHLPELVAWETVYFGGGAQADVTVRRVKGRRPSRR